MAIIAATAGGGNWNATSTWVGGVVPGISDDVLLDGTSGSVSINVGASCRSLDCTGYTGTLTHNASFALSIGASTAGAGNAALKMSPTMTYSPSSSSATINLVTGFTAQQQTLNSGGLTQGKWNVNCSSTTANYLLADNYNGGSFGVASGGLDTGGFSISCTGSYDNNATTGRLSWGSSAISASTFSVNASAGLVINPNTATLTLVAANPSMNTAGRDLQGLSVISNLGGGFTCTGGATFKDITVNGVSGVATGKIAIGGANALLAATGALTVAGFSAANRIFIYGTILGSAGKLSAATTSLTNADFRDVTAQGAAAPFTGTVMGNVLGNSNIVFDAPVDRFAVASGNMSNAAIWSDTSGGAPSASTPLPQDNALLDGNSGTGTITVDVPRICTNLDCTGYKGTLAVGMSTENYGSIKFSSTMTLSGSFSWSWAGRGNHMVTSAGRRFNTVMITAIGGSYSLQDNFSQTDLTIISHTFGTFNSNDFNIEVGTYSVSQSGVGNFGNSQVVMNNTGNGNVFVLTGTGVVTANQAIFTIKYATTNPRTFSIGNTNNNFANCTINYTIKGSSGSLTLTLGAIGTLNFYDVTNARTLILPNNSTTTITKKFYVHGYPAGKTVSIQSVTAGTKSTLSMASGAVGADYLSIKDSTATGGATWYAGRNSTDVSNNTGWIFASPQAIGGFMPFIAKG